MFYFPSSALNYLSWRNFRFFLFIPISLVLFIPWIFFLLSFRVLIVVVIHFSIGFSFVRIIISDWFGLIAHLSILFLLLILSFSFIIIWSSIFFRFYLSNFRFSFRNPFSLLFFLNLISISGRYLFRFLLNPFTSRNMK